MRQDHYYQNHWNLNVATDNAEGVKSSCLKQSDHLTLVSTINIP